MPLQNVIFDFNGVLFWDTHIHEHVWKTYALKLRGKPLTKQELHEHFHGRTNKACFAYLLGRDVQGAELIQLTAEREALYRRLCLEQGSKFTLSSGAVRFLNYLVKNNTPHTIATSSEKTNVDFFFAHLHLAKWFPPESVVYDEGLYPGKPAPYIYRIAAEKIHANPADCIVIEDAKSGIQAAFAAGIGTIIALGPKENHANLQKIEGVTRTISSLGELIRSSE